MKNSKMPIIMMMLFTMVLLGINSIAQAQVAVATVTETVVFNYGENRFMTSKKGEVDNDYTNAIITEKGNKIVFKLNTKQGEQFVSEYKIVSKTKKGKFIVCKKISDGSQILIVQKKHSMTVNLHYVESADKYDAAIVFSDMEFVSEV